ncbi:N-acetylmuramoyl-L-alanine amidase [Streptomyces sp. NPDC093598]|uniref:N-acetylmuramoyl-L-alanine amidase n=1 Tax=Streptomyces sp. NPDC093598 TaxID=3366046 RepID=UPI0037FE1433
MATPLSAARLVEVLRAEGVTVHEVRSWRTHNRNHRGAWGPVHGVMIHHTVTGPGTDVVNLIYDGHSALPGPLSTGCITKDGVVHLTSNGRANHAGGGDGDVLDAVINESYADRPPATHKHDGSPGAVDGNARFYGWECENEGDGKDPWPRVQYAAIVKATAAICREHGWSAKSGIGHLEWSDWKVDPRGFDMTDFRRDLAACLALPAGQWEGNDDMALTDSDVRKVADAVVAKLIAGGGALENSDLDRVWTRDVIPAARPPYNNPDYYGADGKTVANDTWTAKYTLQTTVEGVREAVARLRNLEGSARAVDMSDADISALASAVASNPALAEQIAEKVAIKLAERLAE